MNHSSRSISFWLFTAFLFISLLLLLLGQTMAIINYEFTVQLGLQESIDEVGPFGVQLNRAFAAADTLIYIPLIFISIIGLILKKPWSLFTTATVMGISAYWASTIAFLFNFLVGIPGYSLEPGFEYWLILSVFIISGFAGLVYIVFRGQRLLH